jgi:hypothetical protein
MLKTLKDNVSNQNTLEESFVFCLLKTTLRKVHVYSTSAVK